VEDDVVLPEDPPVSEAAPVAGEVPAAEGDEPPAVEAEGGEPAGAAEPKPGEAKPAEPVEGASTLPAAYRRTAKSREWTDEEIDGFYKQNPELAVKTFSKMHESRVKELAEWAALGRSGRQQPPAPAAPAAGPAPAPAAAPVLAPINIAAMVEKYGNEDLIRELAGPLNAAIQAVQPLIQQSQSQQQEAARTQQETLGRMVQEFFTAKEMAEFKDVYGGDFTSLTPKQMEARSQVLELADALIAGARMQGRSFTVEDALKAAHDSASREQVEKIVLGKVRKSVVARERGITLKPSHNGGRPNSGPPKDRAEMERRARDRLREAFG
jgi:hypothetical protein